MDLHHDLSAGHRVVVHAGIEKSKTAGSEGGHFFVLNIISHSNFERSGNDSDVFPLGMPVGCDPVSVGHLQTHRVVTVEAVGLPSSTANCAPGG